MRLNCLLYILYGFVKKGKLITGKIRILNMNMCRKELKYYTDTQRLQTGLFDLNQGLKSWFKQKQKKLGIIIF